MHIIGDIVPAHIENHGKISINHHDTSYTKATHALMEWRSVGNAD